MTIAIPANATHVCGVPAQNPHTYGLAGSATVTTAQTGTVGGGATIVFDADAAGCNFTFTGDYEFGVGGAYFGIAGNEQVNADCGLGLHLHEGTTVTVSPNPVGFAAGYEGWDGGPLAGGVEAYCENDGIIGDDVEDCIESFFGSSAPVDPCANTDTHAGLNLDAGVWIFLECTVSDAPSASCAVGGTVLVH